MGDSHKNILLPGTMHIIARIAFVLFAAIAVGATIDETSPEESIFDSTPELELALSPQEAQSLVSAQTKTKAKAKMKDTRGCVRKCSHCNFRGHAVVLHPGDY